MKMKMKMKMIIAVMAVLLSLALTGYSQKSPSEPRNYQSIVKNEVESTIRSFLAGFSTSKCDNVTPVSKFVHDNMIYVAEKDIYTISLAEYEQGVRERVCGWVSHSGAVDSVVVDAFSRDAAVAAWIYHDEYKLKSGETKKVKGSSLMTLVRTPTGWKITSTKSSEQKVL